MLKRFFARLSAIFILSSLSICSFPFVPVAADVQYDDSIFNGNATYLLQEHFATKLGLELSGIPTKVLSGWDVDYRGGYVLNLDRGLQIADGDDEERIRLNHKLMSHTQGDLVFETAFSIDGMASSGYYYKIFGNGGTALKLEVNNGNLCYLDSSDNYVQLSDCTVDNVYYIKAVLSMSEKTISIYVNGIFKVNVGFKETAVSGINEVEIGTGIEQDCYATLKFVNFYINYMVNELFMTAPAGAIPEGWNLSSATQDSGISKALGSPYYDDPNGFKLVNSASENAVALTKSFPQSAGKMSVSWNMIIPQKRDGVKVTIKSEGSEVISVETQNGNIVVGNTVVCDNYRANMWYNFEIMFDGACYYIYMNHKLEHEVSGNFTGADYIEFSINSQDITELVIDDVIVQNKFDYSDYPTAPAVANSDGYDVGMVMYPMWREGTHFGWDTIAPYSEERKPYLGYYTEGSVEVADWDNKWLIEHGFDYQIFPFVRPASADGEPVKTTVRGEAFHSGYLHSEYSGEQMKFAILFSEVSARNYYGIDDFNNNVLPYITDYYFKDPRYMTFENKAVIYTYNFANIVNVFGGIANMEAIIDSLDTAARGQGYDGIVFAADIGASSGESAGLADQISGIYKWWYGWFSDQPNTVINGFGMELNKSSDVIASVPMGYDTTPWRSSSRGFMSVNDISNIFDYIKSTSARHITLTCWNEYGEGHFFAPAALHGFDYLNVVRDKFTSDGINLSESLPSAQAIARMGVLYPEGRGTLKVNQDRKIPETLRKLICTQTGIEGLSALWNNSACAVINTSDATERYATSNNANISIDVTSLNIDASEIQYIKSLAYLPEGHNGVAKLYYTTTDSTNLDEYKTFRATIAGTSSYGEYVLSPYDSSKLTGKLKTIRLDPVDATNLLQDTKFGIKYIDFIGVPKDITVNLDDDTVNLTSRTISTDTIYIPIYKFLIDNLKAYATWDYETKTLTAEKNGKVVKVTADSNTIISDGIPKEITYTPFYSAGNLFVPYSGILEEFGYTVNYDSSNRVISYQSQHYGELISDPAYPYVWNFDVDENLEGWYGAFGKIAKLKTKDGSLRISSNTNDPVIYKDDANIDSSIYKYALIRVKHSYDKYTKASLRLYNESGERIDYVFTMPVVGSFSDYLINLTTDQYSTSTTDYSDLGAITRLRFDPVESKYGISYVDSIKILTDVPGNKSFEINSVNITNPDGGENGTVIMNGGKVTSVDVYKNATVSEKTDMFIALYNISQNENELELISIQEIPEDLPANQAHNIPLTEPVQIPYDGNISDYSVKVMIFNKNLAPFSSVFVAG